MEYHNTGRGFGAYLKDSVTFGNVTIMFGLRSETQKLVNDEGVELLNWGLENFISPRFSFAWDITGDGENVFKFGIGSFTDTMLFDLLPYFTRGGGSTFRVWRWVGPLPTYADDGAALKNKDNWVFNFSQGTPESFLEGGYAIDIKEGTGPDRMTKIVAGFDRRLGANWAVKLRGVYTNHSDMLEDLAYFDYEGLFYVLQNWDQKRRSYLGLEVEVQGRIADTFYLSGSYVWSSAKGTTLGAYEAFDNYSITAYNTVGIYGDHCSGPADSPLAWLDPITVGFGGDAHGDEGWYGPLQDSCDHVVKVLATWMAPKGFIISGALQWYNGYAWSIHGWQPAYGLYGTFPYGRGTERYPAHTYVDLTVQKDFRLSSALTLAIRANINNLFNSQQVIALANGEGSAIFRDVWGRQYPRWLQFQVMLRF
jgi:hypothetical protein